MNDDPQRPTEGATGQTETPCSDTPVDASNGPGAAPAGRGEAPAPRRVTDELLAAAGFKPRPPGSPRVITFFPATVWVKAKQAAAEAKKTEPEC
jgi:hypothetical protein